MLLQKYQMNSLKIKDKYKEIVIPGKNPKPNILLIGITYTQKIHKLAWEINSMLNILLSKADDFIINDDMQKCFALFKDVSSPLKSYYLIENKIEDYILSKKFKNIDIFFIVTLNNEISTESQEYLKSIKCIKEILGAFTLEPCKDINSAFLQFSQ